VLLQPQDPHLARELAVVPRIGQRRELAHRRVAAELRAREHTDRVALAAGGPGASGDVQLHVVAERHVLAPRALGAGEHALLGALQHDAHGFVVDPHDDIGAPGQLRVDPAEVVEPVEIGLGEAGRQSDVGDLLAGGVAEGGAQGALVDGTHEGKSFRCDRRNGETDRRITRTMPGYDAAPGTGFRLRPVLSLCLRR